ncbi:hypothetical protein KUCAC02_013279 [Chaenocephalus aceratus]|nr:hypothetical protein KUCAC02_013279 [Chaenocephalus aceratus]
MYERHKRRYSLRAKGERTVDVVLLKIHRDREASFHQPCSTPLSGSSQPSEFPSLPSRTSALRDSGSDIESLLSAEPGYDGVFRKVSTCPLWSCRSAEASPPGESSFFILNSGTDP